mgnify:CR=1 FL=1
MNVVHQEVLKEAISWLGTIPKDAIVEFFWFLLVQLSNTNQSKFYCFFIELLTLTVVCYRGQIKNKNKRPWHTHFNAVDIFQIRNFYYFLKVFVIYGANGKFYLHYRRI